MVKVRIGMHHDTLLNSWLAADSFAPLPRRQAQRNEGNAMARREENDDTKRGLSNRRIFVSRRHVGNVARALDSISSGAKWKMAEGERRSIFSDRARNGRTDKSNPLLSSAGKIQVSEKSSLSQSFEAPKCYGTTRNPMQPQCDVKLIGHVLHPSDTLQGLAIKYGVTVSRFFVQKTHKLRNASPL